MPDKWDKYAEPASSDKWDKYAEPAGATESHDTKASVPGFFGTLASDIAGIPGGIYQTVRHPIDTARGMFGATESAVSRTGEALKKRQYSEAAQSALGAIPLLGPQIEETVRDVGQGHYGRASARALEFLGPEAAKALKIERLGIPLRRTVANVNNPVVEEALKSVEGDVRMTPGQRAGQAALQTSERDLLNKPGTASRAHEFYAGQQEDIAQAGGKRVVQQGGKVTNPYGAGSEIQGRLQERVTMLKGYADKLYDSTRKTTARNVEEVQTGTREVPASTILGPSGEPAIPAHEVPIIEKLETPVNLAPVRAGLKTIYEDLKRSLPEARRANSPAFRALDELMNSDVQQMQAMDFDKFLSAVKSITRDGTNPLLTTQSQGLAKQVIRSGENEFRKAIHGAGPNVVDKLERARKAVREYHDTADFLNDLNSEPAALYSNLVTGGDRVKNTLTYLNRTAPDAVRTVGRTFLEELMDKATREGGWGRSAGVFADWNRMGPETKNLIFGPELSKNMDEFLLAAKRLTPVVGSPTADRLSALVSYGDVGVALSEFIGGSVAGHPTVGALAAGGTLLKTRLQPAILARLSFKPKGVQLLKQATTLPVTSPAFNQTMRALTLLANEENASPQ